MTHHTLLIIAHFIFLRTFSFLFCCHFRWVTCFIQLACFDYFSGLSRIWLLFRVRCERRAKKREKPVVRKKALQARKRVRFSEPYFTPVRFHGQVYYIKKFFSFLMYGVRLFVTPPIPDHWSAIFTVLLTVKSNTDKQHNIQTASWLLRAKATVWC